MAKVSKMEGRLRFYGGVVGSWGRGFVGSGVRGVGSSWVRGVVGSWGRLEVDTLFVVLLVWTQMVTFVL